MQSSGSFGEVIRYEQEIKAKIQQTDNTILDEKRDSGHLRKLNELIQEEDILIKYLEVESSKLPNQVKLIYIKNINRFKKKIKQHKEYTNTFFGEGAVQNTNAKLIQQTLKFQSQNAQLINNKQTMYENQNVQRSIGGEVQRQGGLLQVGIDHNRGIRRDADQAEGSIDLIRRSILKRKLMFFSLVGLLILAGIFVLYRKLNH